jgi:hypothetical protein
VLFNAGIAEKVGEVIRHGQRRAAEILKLARLRCLFRS